MSNNDREHETFAATPATRPSCADASTGLRERAERLLSGQASPSEMPAGADMPLLLHELRVHQAELELQNEELRRVQQELEASRARYFGLCQLPRPEGRSV